MSEIQAIENENYITPPSRITILNNHSQIGPIPSQGYPSIPPPPVVIQPSNLHAAEETTGWINIPLSLQQTNYPPALDYLATLTNLTIEQQPGSDHRQFFIKNCRGDNVFIGNDDSSFCLRCCLGARHYPINMKILDIFGTEIINFQRFPSLGFLPSKLQVFSPPGNLIGSIEEKWSFFHKIFHIKNQQNEKILKVKDIISSGGRACGECVVNFKILSNDNKEIAKITRKSMEFSELLESISFVINFPRDLTINMKVLLIAACFATF